MGLYQLHLSALLPEAPAGMYTYVNAMKFNFAICWSEEVACLCRLCMQAAHGSETTGSQQADAADKVCRVIYIAIICSCAGFAYTF